MPGNKCLVHHKEWVDMVAKFGYTKEQEPVWQILTPGSLYEKVFPFDTFIEWKYID